MSDATRRWALWAVGVALIVAACFVMANAPRDSLPEEPFLATAQVGEPSEARVFTATVTAAHRVESLSAPQGLSDTWVGDGNWLVLSLEVTPTRAPDSMLLSTVKLVLPDGRSYTPSGRFDRQMSDTPLEPGLTYQGTLVFELPDGDQFGEASLRMGPSIFTNADSLTDIRINLDDLPRETSMDIPEGGLKT